MESLVEDVVLSIGDGPQLEGFI